MTISESTQSEIEQRWEKLRSLVAAKWNLLTKKDLAMIDGDSRKLIALIHQRTGENLPDIEDAIREIAAGSGGLLSRVGEYSPAAAALFNERIYPAAAHSYDSFSERVRANPTSAMLVALSVGVLLGVCISPRR